MRDLNTMQSQLLMIHTRSPLHCGTGHARGAVDLPIARESVSQLPYIPASGIKGALRNAALDARIGHKEVSKLFGGSAKDTTRTPDAGELSFGDGALIAIPVSSLNGVYAYATCPHLLRSLRLDLNSLGMSTPSLVDPQLKALVPSHSRLTRTTAQGQKRITLSEYNFIADSDDQVTSWADLLCKLFKLDEYEATQLKARFCLISDDSFKLLADRSIEVNVRVSLDRETRTAAIGALWTEENLPSNSLLYSLCYATPNQRRAASTLYETLQQAINTEVQLGGNATIGRGRCAMNLYRHG